MKTLRVTLADIIGPTGTPNSTATVHARYVDTSGRGRDVHLTDGTIVVPVRRVAAPDGDPEVFDFDVYANDVAPVREVDYGHLVEVSWTVVAPTGAKTSGVRRVAVTDGMASVVQLGLLSTPTPVPPYTGGYSLPGHKHVVGDITATGAPSASTYLRGDGSWSTPAGGTGGTGSTVTADDTPAAPAEGESATYFVTSAVSWPVGLVWSTDPDGDVAPTIVEAALVSMFTLDGVTRAVMGATFPAPVIPDTTPPGIPAGLSAVAASHTTVTLSWTASTDDTAVTGYEYRVNGGAAVDAGAGVSGLVTGLTAATAYDFEVRAYDAAGNRSGWSTVATETTDAAPDVTAPTAPTGLTATATGSTTVGLAWTASTDAVGVTGYEYRIDGGTAVDAGAGVTETVTSLSPSTAYTFEVRAYDAAGNRSAWSTVATETTDAAADSTPPTVGTLAGSSITASGFTLTVSGAADETALHATPYRFSTDDGATYSAWQTAATYAATGLTASTGYTCKHQTRDAAGNVSTGTGVVVTTGSAASLAYVSGVTGVEGAAYSFALGTTSATRTVVVAAAVASHLGPITAVTIGGIAATIDVSWPTTTRNACIARATVPTGASADVVVTGPSGVGANIDVWVTTGAATLVSQNKQTQGDSTTCTVTLGAAGQQLIGVAVARDTANAATHAFTNMTSRRTASPAGSYAAGDGTTSTTLTSKFTGGTVSFNGLAVAAYNVA